MDFFRLIFRIEYIITGLIIASLVLQGVAAAQNEMITSKDMHILTAPPSVGSDSIQTSKEYAPDRLIVRYNTDQFRTESAMISAQSVANADAGTSVIQDLSTEGVPGMQIVQVKSNSLKDAMATYEEDPNVMYVEPDYKISVSPIETVGKTSDVDSLQITSTSYPNDPGYTYLWGLHNTGQAPFYGTSGADIDAPLAWSATTGSSGVTIALVDTGVDYTHPDLAANIWTNPGEIPNNGKDDDGNGYIDDVHGWNFVSKNNDPMDDNGHGTHCAGTIAAVGNNGIGVTGVTWNSKIMPLKFLDSAGSGYVSDAISAILYANRMGVPVISNSWSGTGFSQSLKDAIDASSAVVICAAGNSAANADVKPEYPAAFTSSNIISVAATNYNDNIASFSNYGPVSVDIGAPGVSIYSTTKSSSYKYLSGTSMATPFVAGVAALLKAKSSSMSASEIKSKILDNCDKLSQLSGKTLTGGRLNAAKALGQSETPTTSTPTPTPTPTPTTTITTPVPTATTTPIPTATPFPTYSPKVSAGFYASPTSGNTPLRVQFIDQSTGKPTSWTWAFGDGGFSYQKNPVHVYLKKGSYSVRLNVSRDGVQSSIYKKLLITVS